MSWAAILLAAALLTVPGASGRRIATPARPRRSAPPRADDPLAAASAFDLFAACLSAGMALSSAASATAASAPAPVAALLTRAAELLRLGADPATAWSNGELSQDKNADALLRLARRSAASGTALAHGAAELADQCRHDASATAEAAAGRASVLIAGPLGLCYLPAFVCLGIVPVIAGLAGDVLGSGLS